MVWGVTLPWNLLASVTLSVWLMAAPSVFGSQGRAADSDHLVGALLVTIAAIATAEVIRAGRYLNVPLSLWVIASAWLLVGETAASRWNDVAVGLLVVVLTLPRGSVRERYGNWDRCVI